MKLYSYFNFSKMFFVNEDASRHFLAPPSIKVFENQYDYSEKRLVPGFVAPLVTTASTNTENTMILPRQSAEKVPSLVAKQRPHNCEECGKTFLMKHHLTTHMRVHTGERPHICPDCGKSFALKHCLSTHLLLHTADRPYKCVQCNKSFTLKHHLVSHERVHTRERPFECPECGKRFPQKRHLSTHIKFHAGERPFSCQECGESFSREEHFIMHSRFHGGLNPYNCSDCGAGFMRKFELVNHERQHGRNPESCPTCGKEFLQKRTLLVHLRGCGMSSETPAQFNNSSSLPKCSSVNNSSSFPGNTSNHLRFSNYQTTGLNNSLSVTKDKVCKECGETFSSMEGLTLHLRLHFGDHSFLADICSLAASLKQTAVNVATSLKKSHICTDCGRGFTQRHGLFQHRQQHANGSCKEKAFACAKCGKSFAQKNHLALHDRQHMDYTNRVPESKRSTSDCCTNDQAIESSKRNNTHGDSSEISAVSLSKNQLDISNRLTQDVSLSDNRQSPVYNNQGHRGNLIHVPEVSSRGNVQRTSQSDNPNAMKPVNTSVMFLEQNQSTNDLIHNMCSNKQY